MYCQYCRKGELIEASSEKESTTDLEQYEYLSGVPVMREVYEKTEKDETLEIHEEAPRPELPEAVRTALTPREVETVTSYQRQ